MTRPDAGASLPTDMIIDCAFETQWPQAEARLEQLAVTAIEAAAAGLQEEVESDSEVSLLFTDDDQVRQLNAQWRQIDKPTNVLSFAAREAGGPPTPVLGDVVLARETIAREAQEQCKSFDDHLTHLIIHGFLHLLGFDHISDGEAEEMEQLERQVLAGLGIADPYETT